MSGYNDDVECPTCDGWGNVERNSRHDSTDCPACNGTGWRPMTSDELDAAAERQAEDAMSEPPMSLNEQHRAAWEQKQELRR